ncbi:MAG: DNA polymerase III subunit delta' [Ignavibacteriales bacterium]|nr:DNA polymerase III subunit delta' [Ignavibacteriales bacterium]
MSWSSVIGHEREKEIIIGSLKRNRLAHAYLFTGPEGIGKYSFALELTKTVNCEKQLHEACDECASCKKFATLQHPNLHLIFNLPVGKNENADDSPIEKLSQDEISGIQDQLRLLAENPFYKLKISRANAIKINSVREIRREAALTMFGKGKKVFIIIDAEKMNDPAANALLKTLEEPHPDTMLILLSNVQDALLPTIVSRCQHLRFVSLSEDVIGKALEETKLLDKKTARQISRLANGSYSKALQLVGTEYQNEQKQALDLLRLLITRSRSEIIAAAEQIAKEKERPEIETTIRLLQHWFRDGMVIKENIVLPDAEADDITLSKFIRAYPRWDYQHSVEILEKAVSLLDKNVYIPLIIIDMAINLRSAVGTASIAR